MQESYYLQPQNQTQFKAIPYIENDLTNAQNSKVIKTKISYYES